LLTCREFLAELNDYLDENEKIDVELRRKLESHITECPNCWVVCDTTKKTIQVYKGMNAQAIPDAVHARLVRALERKMADKNRESGEQV
jgi:hypothetical protein